MNLSMRRFLNVAASLFGISLLFDHVFGGTKSPVLVEVVNDLTPKLSVRIYWIGENGPTLISEGIKTSLSVNTFVSHSFLAVPEDVDVDISLYADHPNVTTFTIEEYDQYVILKREDEALTATKINYATVAKEMLMETISSCIEKEQGVSEWSTCSSDTDQPLTLNSDVLDCVSSVIGSKEAKLDSQLRHISSLLNSVGDHLRNYTCADPEEETPSMDDTRTLQVKKWRDHDVQVLLDDEDARLMVLHDFISVDQCNVLLSKSMNELKPAEVTSSEGERKNSVISNARRAAAHVVVPDLSDENDIIAMLFKKAYDFANDETGYNLTVDSSAQEGFNVISYEHGDEYIPHCDGSCDGSNYKPGGRVSTMVFYCSEAEEGGGTSFSNVDAFVKGKKGQATFFSYLGPDMKMDKGKTKHRSGVIKYGGFDISQEANILSLQRGSAERKYLYQVLEVYLLSSISITRTRGNNSLFAFKAS